MCNFADDNTLSSCGKMASDMLHSLKFELGHILKWFKVNSLKPNPSKFQFMTLETNTGIKVNLFLDGNNIEKSQKVVLLETINNDKLSFKTHIENIYRKAKYKLHALQHIRNYLSTDKAKILCNTFINSQFYYVPVIWMFVGKLFNSRVQISIFGRYKWFITHMTFNYFQ